MQLNQETDYALRVVLHLCKLGMEEKVEARVIAEVEKVPIRFLLKLLRKLNGAGIVKSYRGVNGGYAVNRPPQDISLKDVIEAIEGPIYVNRCLYDVKLCTGKGRGMCEIHNALTCVQKRLMDNLRGISFKDIMEGNI